LAIAALVLALSELQSKVKLDILTRGGLQASERGEFAPPGTSQKPSRLPEAVALLSHCAVFSNQSSDFIANGQLYGPEASQRPFPSHGPEALQRIGRLNVMPTTATPSSDFAAAPAWCMHLTAVLPGSLQLVTRVQAAVSPLSLQFSQS
jgi:hypothetical protein